MRHHLAQLLVLEVVHVHVQRVAFGPIIRAAVLEVADQLLLLGVNRDDGLARGLGRNDLRVDVLELCIAIGMARALECLAVDLP